MKLITSIKYKLLNYYVNLDENLGYANFFKSLFLDRIINLCENNLFGFCSIYQRNIGCKHFNFLNTF